MMGEFVSCKLYLLGYKFIHVEVQELKTSLVYKVRYKTHSILYNYNVLYVYDTHSNELNS